MQYRLDRAEAPCPACHATHAERLYRVDAEQAAQHYVLREADPDRHDALRDHIAGLWDGPTCDVLRCTACGLGFAWPYVAGDSRFYDLAYERSGYPTWKWEFERTLEALRAAELPQAFSVLEVGAGDGAFLKRLTPALTPPDRALATEFSDYGRRAIEAHGVRCLAADVRTLPPDVHGAPFDVLCLFQVLEHLDDLDALMEQFGALTTPDAHLFVAVPNDARITFNEQHGSLLDMPPNHIGRWTRPAFEALAGRHGWRVEAHEVEVESASSKVSGSVMYRYMRRRQQAGTLANRLERLPRSAPRKVLQGVLAGAYGLGALPSTLALVRDDTLGSSQWVHLRRMR